MKKVLFLLVSTLVLTYVGISLTLAQEAEKKAEAPAAAEQPKAPAVKPETLSGTLQSVVADQKLVVVTAASGVPFNFKVTGATKIKCGGSKGKLADLSGATGKSVSVKFLPEKKAGNIAVSIEVQ
jgi:hypothetical protein